MTSEATTAVYFTTGALVQKEHGGPLISFRYSEGDISCRISPIVETKTVLDTQGDKSYPNIGYFIAEGRLTPRQYQNHGYCKL